MFSFLCFFLRGGGDSLSAFGLFGYCLWDYFVRLYLLNFSDIEEYIY